jgi:hypothetical protein
MPITTKIVSSNPAQARCTRLQHYALKFVSDFRQVCGFLGVLRFSFTSNTDCHHITEILLKVVLNTINQTVTCRNLKLLMLTNIFTINHGRTVQRKTTIISFTCIAEINYIHKVMHLNTQ